MCNSGHSPCSNPPVINVDGRAAMTVSCRDADAIPKVSNAGEILKTSDGSDVQVMHNGILVKRGGYYGSEIESIIKKLRGHHEPQEERAFYEMLKHIPSNGTMIELGAFWSYFTLWFLHEQPNRRALALEPSPQNREIGIYIARLNSLSPIFLEGFAGEKTTGPQPFYAEGVGHIEIPCFAVPELMSAGGFQHLDVLHCDAQGAEEKVLSGCSQLFRGDRISWCCISTHAMQITGDPLTHQRCLEILSDFGAKIIVEHDVHESFSGDGFILAKFGPLPEGWKRFDLSYNRYSRSLFRNPIYDLAELTTK